MSEPRSAPTVGQVVLGRRLLDLRERAGMKREEAARILRVAPATVRRMEMAEVALKIPYLQLLLKAYGITDEEADAFVQLAEEANKPGWWQRFHDILPGWFSMYVSLEGAAGAHPQSTSPTSSPGCCRPRTTRAVCSGRAPSARPGPTTSSAMSPCACSVRNCSPARTRPGCGS